MADEHTLAEQNGHTMMHTYICIHPLTVKGCGVKTSAIQSKLGVLFFGKILSPDKQYKTMRNFIFNW